MHKLLSDWLKKLNINKIDDLNSEELSTYRKWESILSKEKLRIDDVKKFCEKEISKIEDKWSVKAQPELIPYHVVYTKLIKLIESPQTEREQLEKYLTNLIK